MTLTILSLLGMEHNYIMAHSDKQSNKFADITRRQETRKRGRKESTFLVLGLVIRTRGSHLLGNLSTLFSDLPRQTQRFSDEFLNSTPGQENENRSFCNANSLEWHWHFWFDSLTEVKSETKDIPVFGHNPEHRVCKKDLGMSNLMLCSFQASKNNSLLSSR